MTIAPSNHARQQLQSFAISDKYTRRSKKLTNWVCFGKKQRDRRRRREQTSFFQSRAGKASLVHRALRDARDRGTWPRRSVVAATADLKTFDNALREATLLDTSDTRSALRLNASIISGMPGGDPAFEIGSRVPCDGKVWRPHGGRGRKHGLGGEIIMPRDLPPPAITEAITMT
jgi:hypothetical protein